MFLKKNIIKIITISLIFFPILFLNKHLIKAYSFSYKIDILSRYDPQTGGWINESEKIPENAVITNIHISKNHQYCTTLNHGIYFRTKNRVSWSHINDPDFKTRSVYDTNFPYRKISGFAVNPKQPNIIALATKHDLYLSYNSGKNWKKITRSISGEKYYFTSLSFYNSELFAGTAFNGVLKLKGSSLHTLLNGLPGEPYSKTLKFYNEISAIGVSSENKLYAACSFRNGLFVLETEKNPKKWIKVKIPEQLSILKPIDSIRTSKKGLIVSAANQFYIFNEKNHTWSCSTPPQTYNNQTLLFPVSEKEWFASIKNNSYSKNNSEDFKAIYLNPYAAAKGIDSYIKKIKGTPVNAFVIDMKDDFGYLYFPSKNPIANKIKAVKKIFNIKSIIEKLHKKGIYVIARIVVFKDKKLYKSFNYKYAIKNKRNNMPWKGNPREYWVDPYSEDVHEYNISLAQECEKLGFDEIQFDYIRFPSDGQTHLCSYTFNKNISTYKSEILTDFLHMAKKKLNKPVSIDVYGFNVWYHFGNRIGQDIEAFASIVDTICPMVYPSHFGRKFYNNGNMESRSYHIVKQSGLRSIWLSENYCNIRPYLQAFNLLSPTWGTSYILNQIKGAKDSKCSGYTFWNAAGEYTMLFKAYRKELSAK